MLKTTITHNNQQYQIDLARPIDISIPVGRTKSPNAFYLPEPEYHTVDVEGFVGNVQLGGSCNVENISFSPHGNGTHTECIGHIGAEHTLINNLLKRFFFLAYLVTVAPENDENRSYISKNALLKSLSVDNFNAESLLIRTTPNSITKRTSNYGGTNPTYISAEAMNLVNDLKIRHLLTDLPSVDREDDGDLIAHHIFFGNDNVPEAPKTITEMIFVDDSIKDGLYWLDLQVSGFESDASPSRPVLYEIM
jgi:arylformamidase